jgi:hypothetical protein
MPPSSLNDRNPVRPCLLPGRHTRSGFGRLLWPSLALLTTVSSAPAQLPFTAPAALNTTAPDDNRTDISPQIATDGHGTWVAVWYSSNTLGGAIGSDDDILFQRSTDNGVTWSAAAALNTNAAGDSGADIDPQLATDGQGVWIAVWGSFDSLGDTINTDQDVLYARSTNNGASWSAPAALNSNAAGDLGWDWTPVIVNDGAGVWITIWRSNDTLNDTVEVDDDIFFSRSTDSGVGWSAVATLNTNAATDSGTDWYPDIATDGQGRWVAVWESLDTLGDTIDDDNDILVSRSENGGATWTAPAALNTNAAGDAGDDLRPQATTDRQGNWIAVWESTNELSPSTGGDDDIHFARSTDLGASWTDPAALNSNAATDSGDDTIAQLTTDGHGHWIAHWQSLETFGGTLGADHDILYALSENNGIDWTLQGALNTNAANDSGNDNLSQLTTDGEGAWIAVWQSNDTLGGTVENELDILTTRMASTPGASVVWVDFDQQGIELGTQNYPYNTVDEAVDPVAPAGTVRVVAGTTAETIRITKALRLEATGGAARLGVAAGEPTPDPALPVGDRLAPTPGRSAARSWIFYP